MSPVYQTGRSLAILIVAVGNLGDKSQLRHCGKYLSVEFFKIPVSNSMKYMMLDALFVSL